MVYRLVLTIWLLIVGTSAVAKITVGTPAPAFIATQFDGTKVKLADYKGQVLVLNIWATWCAPCKAELPLLDRFYQLTAKHGLRVLAVTTEDSLPNSALKPLQAALKLPLARYFRGPYQAIGGSVPTNFVIDRAGVVRYAKAGAFDLAELNQILIPLLNEPPPAG